MDETTRISHILKEYVECRYNSDDSFSVFIVEYGERFKETKRYNLELHTGVQRCINYAQECTNMTPDLERLARIITLLVSKMNYRGYQR